MRAGAPDAPAAPDGRGGSDAARAPRAEPFAATKGEPGLVSVVIPVFDGFPRVLEALDSLRAQTHERWEAIVVDDGSREEQGPLIASRWSDPRLRVLRTTNGGPGRARLRGLAAARGEFFQLLDQDDLLSPDKLARQVAYLRAHPEVDLVYTDVYHFASGPGGSAERFARPPFPRPPAGDVLPELVRHSFLLNEGVLARRGLLDGLTLEDLEGNVTTNDWHFWLQVLLPRRQAAYHEAGRGWKRVHGDCTSRSWRGIVAGRIRVYEWLSRRLPPGRLEPAHVAAMEVEWAKDAALLGHLGTSRAVLRRAVARCPGVLLRGRVATALALHVGPLRAPLLELRRRRDPYQALLESRAPGEGAAGPPST